MQTDKLIQSLTDTSNDILNNAEYFISLDIKSLTFKPDPDSWNILECVEHLNLYYNFYLPEISNSIKQSKSTPVAIFKPGFLGNYFANSMLPKDKLNKMKTFKDKNPLNDNLDKSVITTFIENQKTFADLIRLSCSVNLNKAKVKISIAPFIRLKLGDTLRFITNHNMRHLKQIENLLKMQ